MKTFHERSGKAIHTQKKLLSDVSKSQYNNQKMVETTKILQLLKRENIVFSTILNKSSASVLFSSSPPKIQ